MATDLYAQVTAKILEQLERGTVPWRKPWSATAGNNVPCNAISNRPYSGCNTVLLWLALDQGWKAPRFLTFGQALACGGNVKRGEHGYKVIFVKKLAIIDKSKPEGEDARVIPMAKLYTVFDTSQCEGLPAHIIEGKPPRIRNKDQRDLLADEFMQATGADIREGHGEAAFIPCRDFISLPAWHAFNNKDSFYATAWHELSHWTGHPSRLDRQLKNKFGGKDYAKEELVAELGASFLSAEFGHDNLEQASSYIAGWIQLLKDDKKAFVSAASQAQKAADYLRALALKDSPVTEESAEELAA